MPLTEIPDLVGGTVPERRAMKLRMRQTHHDAVRNEPVTLAAGEEYELPADVAGRILSMGIAEEVKDAGPAPENKDAGAAEENKSEAKPRRRRWSFGR